TGTADQHLAVAARHQIAVAPREGERERGRRPYGNHLAAIGADRNLHTEQRPEVPCPRPGGDDEMAERDLLAVRFDRNHALLARRDARHWRTEAELDAVRARRGVQRFHQADVVDRAVVGEPRAAAYGRIDLRIARADAVGIQALDGKSLLLAARHQAIEQPGAAAAEGEIEQPAGRVP